MTGPEHYREAERLLADAGVEGAEGTYFVRPESLAAAQVHATLALAAATAIPLVRNHVLAEMKAWSEAAGTPSVSIDPLENIS